METGTETGRGTGAMTNTKQWIRMSKERKGEQRQSSGTHPQIKKVGWKTRVGVDTNE